MNGNQWNWGKTKQPFCARKIESQCSTKLGKGVGLYRRLKRIMKGNLTKKWLGSGNHLISSNWSPSYFTIHKRLPTQLFWYHLKGFFIDIVPLKKKKKTHRICVWNFGRLKNIGNANKKLAVFLQQFASSGSNFYFWDGNCEIWIWKNCFITLYLGYWGVVYAWHSLFSLWLNSLGFVFSFLTFLFRGSSFIEGGHLICFLYVGIMRLAP